MNHVVLLPQWLEPPALAGIEYHWWDHGLPEPTDDVLGQVTVFVPPYMPVPADLAIARRMPRLSAVQALMAGVDGMLPHLPAEVPVHRAAGVHDSSTAELALALALACRRGIDAAARDMTHGRWRHERRPALADSRIGIVGWGGVGQAIASRLRPFEVSVLGFSRSGHGCLPVSTFDEYLPGLDILFLALPPPPGGPFMSARRLSLMKDAALLVNVGRGGLVDTNALHSELESGRLRAALDVTDPEPLPPDHPLWSCPNLLITPHVGGDSDAFVPRARAMIDRQLRRLATTGTLR